MSPEPSEFQGSMTSHGEGDRHAGCWSS
jgi:hypothetical protein